MKVKKITIAGMHKVMNKTYDLNDSITYFIGENGAGKSTILEAIQLGLLGYIPGYSKTNESIMKHASGPMMYIELYLDEGIKITRTWARSGSSVQAKVNVEGYDGDLKDLIGEVELPVFDFNEFRSMTANKLKDWFITFLPNSGAELNFKQELTDAAKERAITSSELIEENAQWAAGTGLSGLELVRKANAKFKEDVSFVKGQIANLEGTIRSLVRYDDVVDCNEDEVKTRMEELVWLKSKLLKYNMETEMNAKAKVSVDALRASLPADKFDNDPRVSELKSQLIEISKKNEVLKADYSDLQRQIAELENKKHIIPKGGANCPYTNQPCQTAAELASKSKEQIDEIDKQIQFKREEMKECDSSIWSANDRTIMQINIQLGSIQSEYDRLIAMDLQLQNATVSEKPTDMTIEELDAEYNQLNANLIQLAANKKYDELSSKVTADKFKAENELELYKIWVKLTDANGLQSSLMVKPFEDLASEMSKYLSQMFNKDVIAKFFISEKANSFSFGLLRDSQYIEFDYLSSGERCLFTLALMMCILNKSSSSVRTILIDDILDHLDTDNANYLFSALKTVNDIQFILAGVKECADAEICRAV